VKERSDAELYQGWCDADQKAGLELFHRYYERLWLFFRPRVTGEVEDLIQETFLECLQSHARLRDAASFRAFMFSIARHRLFARIRKLERRDRALGQLAAQSTPMASSPSSIMRKGETDDDLIAALDALPTEMALSLELYYWEELTYEELAYVLGVGREAVKSRLQRAKMLLRERLPDAASARRAPLAEWATAIEQALSTTRAARLRRK
jgi:RNA polymerase sigma-70 factor (ECF subfamily)